MTNLLRKRWHDFLFRRTIHARTRLPVPVLIDKFEQLAHDEHDGHSVQVDVVSAAAHTQRVTVTTWRHLGWLRLPATQLTLTLYDDPTMTAHTHSTRINGAAALHPAWHSLLLSIAAGWLLVIAGTISVGVAPWLLGIIAIVIGREWLLLSRDRRWLLRETRYAVVDREREAIHRLQLRPNVDNLPRYVHYAEPDQWSLDAPIDPRKRHSR